MLRSERSERLEAWGIGTVLVAHPSRWPLRGLLRVRLEP
jgi:hypothetical protein